jgi:AraC-like DNA-binding protein
MNEKLDKISTTKPDFAKFTTDFHYSFMEYKTKYVSPLHYHNVYELYFLESGSREYIINGELYAVETGMLVLIPPGVLHETSGSPFSRKLMHFSRKGLERIFAPNVVADLLDLPECPIYIPNENISLSSIENVFHQARIYFTRGNVRACLSCVAYLLEGTRYMTSGQPKSSRDADKLVDQIIDYVKENANRVENLNEIASTFFISKSHLCHLFKQQKGMTVYDFILKIKIENASKLLTTTKKKIKDISEECGFHSEYYFSRRFFMATGISPSKYRKEFSIHTK